jgi:hypothetical protein
LCNTKKKGKKKEEKRKRGKKGDALFFPIQIFPIFQSIGYYSQLAEIGNRVKKEA